MCCSTGTQCALAYNLPHFEMRHLPCPASMLPSFVSLLVLIIMSSRYERERCVFHYFNAPSSSIVFVRYITLLLIIALTFTTCICLCPLFFCSAFRFFRLAEFRFTWEKSWWRSWLSCSLYVPSSVYAIVSHLDSRRYERCQEFNLPADSRLRLAPSSWGKLDRRSKFLLRVYWATICAAEPSAMLLMKSSTATYGPARFECIVHTHRDTASNASICRVVVK